MSAEEDHSEFIRRYDALPMEERAAFRRAYGDARGVRIRIRDLGPMRSAAHDQPAVVKSTVTSGLRRVPRRNRSTSRPDNGPRTPRRSGSPGTYTPRRRLTVHGRDGETILDIEIDGDGNITIVI